MAVQRCPACGRAVDGTECLACGHSWEAVSAPKPANPFATGAATNTASPTPKETFSAPALAPHIAANPFTGGGPRPVTGLHNGLGPLDEPTINAPRNVSGIDSLASELSQEAPAVPSEPVAAPAFRPPSPAPEPERSIAPPLPALAPRNGFERFLRTQLAFPAIGAAVFLSVLILGLAIAFSGRDELLDEVDASGEGARRVMQRLASQTNRSPREDLILGHANAVLGQPREALDAYRSAAVRSTVDDRALTYVLLALDNPYESAELPRETLSQWPVGDVDDRLKRLLKGGLWHQRHNALDALGRRGKADDDLRLRVAYEDLTDEQLLCPDILRALDVVRDYGAGDKALDAIAAMRGSPTKMSCAADRLPSIESAVKKRG